VLSPATKSSCHRRPRIKVLSARLGQLASANLTPATGARTTRLHRTQHPVSAKGFDGPSAVRLRAIRQLTGLIDPPCHPLASPDAAASTASRPASVTIAKRPSEGRDGEGYRSDLGQTGNEIFLQIGLDRQIGDLPVGQSPWSASTIHAVKAQREVRASAIRERPVKREAMLRLDARELCGVP
jgi:hypothetical protein